MKSNDLYGLIYIYVYFYNLIYSLIYAYIYFYNLN